MKLSRQKNSFITFFFSLGLGNFLFVMFFSFTNTSLKADNHSTLLQITDVIDRFEEPILPLAPQNSDSLSFEEILPPTNKNTRLGKEYTREEIVEYIIQDKQHLFPQQSPFVFPEHKKLKIDQFLLLRPQLPSSSYENKMMNWGEWQRNQFTTEKYPYEVSITRFKGGLGDYNQNFAHLTFLKDGFLAVNNLNFRGDFRGTSALYEEVNNKSADLNFRLKYNFSKLFLTTTHISTQQEIYKKYYYLLGDLTKAPYLTDKWQYSSYLLEYQFFYLGYNTSKNLINAPQAGTKAVMQSHSYLTGITGKLNHHSSHLSAQLDYYQTKNHFLDNWNNSSIQQASTNDLSYQFQYRYSGILNYFQTDFLLFHAHQKIDSQSNLRLHVWKNFYAQSIITYTDENRTDLRVFLENQTQSLYQTGLAFDPSLFFDSASKTGIDSSYSTPYSPSQLQHSIFYSNLLLGSKRINQYFYSEKKTYEFVNISSTITTIFPISRFLFNLKNSFDLHQSNETIVLFPKYENQFDIALKIPLQNDNELGIGSRINIISSLHDEQNKMIKTNPTFDVYISISITKLFDINLEFNNLNRNMNYGNHYLHDFHFTSQVTWYFIN